MRVFVPRTRPEPWSKVRQSVKQTWTVPFSAVEWSWEWVAYVLSNWKFLEVLEYLSSLSVLVAVLFYFSESGDRVKQKHYQAWQVINTAQGKGGSGGRIEALQELNSDGVALVGVDVAGAFLRGIQLERARLVRANFNAADVREGDFRFAELENADLRSANLRSGQFFRVNLNGADLSEADLTGSDLREADLAGATLDGADLHEANLGNLRWREIRSMHRANVSGVTNAPTGFLEWALQNGAVCAIRRQRIIPQNNCLQKN